MEMNLQMNVLATLWENTYRAMVTNNGETYVATVRIIISVPLSEEDRPANAPEVEPQMYVLVEDAVLDAKDIIDFETVLAALLREKFRYQIPHVFFFYPSPEDMLSKTIDA